MSFDLKEHLRALSELHAPTGHEAPARDFLRHVWEPWVDAFQTDGLGSLLATKRGEGKKAPRILISVHMDEIALMVTEVREGYLRVGRMGGMDGRTLNAKPVLVHGKETLRGVVAATPPHISNQSGDGKSTYPPVEALWIDLGLPADKVADLVRVGDAITLDAPLLELEGDCVAGKVMDNRASVAAASHCLHLLQKRRHVWDVVVAATVQEERGLLGAGTAAYTANPHLAIACDVDFAQQPGVNSDKHPKLGKGVTLGVGPNFHPALVAALKKTAKACEIPLHETPISGRSGTDAWAIQTARAGVPTALLGIPLRNMHSHVETASLRDIQRMGRLMAEFITELEADFLDSLAWRPEEPAPTNGETEA